MSHSVLVPAAACLLAAATACGGPGRSTYEWGGYQNSVREFAAQPGGVDVGAHVARLTASEEKSLLGGRPLPPGFQAHLGYLLLLQGDIDRALVAFESEMQSYPESRAFVAGLLDRLEGAQ